MLIIPGSPFPKQRARTTRHVTFTPARTRNAEERIRVLARQWWGPVPDEGTVRLDVAFYRENHIRVDVDNLTKLVMDALNGVTWIDDNQVITLAARKRHDAKNPRTEISVTREEP